MAAMKRSIAFACGFAVAALPLFAGAQTAPTVAQLTARIAALEAQENAAASGQSLACAAVFSAPSVKVGDSVALAWGSVGALDPLTSSSSVPMWSRNGASTLTFAHPATWTYFFTFYDVAGDQKTCYASVRVTA